MPKIAFVMTDPSVVVVTQAIGELRAQDEYDIVGYTEVTSDAMCGNDENPSLWRSWNDFARTAGSVMRMYMLKATDMLQLHNPTFGEPGKSRNLAAMQYVIKHGNPPKPIDMAADETEAKVLSAEFDRQYPHFILQNKFDGMAVGTNRSHRALMYVVDIPNNVIYHIISTLTVTLVAEGPGDDGKNRKIITAIPFVAALKLQLKNDLLQRYQDPATYQYTRILADMITRFQIFDEAALIQAIENVKINDAKQDDDEGGNGDDARAKKLTEMTATGRETELQITI